MLEYLLAITPFYESRYVIPLLVLEGKSIFDLVIVLILNLLAYPALLFFLDKVNSSLLKIELYKNIYRGIINIVSKRRAAIERYGYFGLFLFVLTPLPTTGIYSATLLTWLLGLNRKKAFIYIALGLVCLDIILYYSIFFGIYLFT